MNIDQEIVEAIKDAVERFGQDSAVADNLIAWISSVAGGNESLAKQEQVQRRLDLLLENVQVALATDDA